MTPDQYTNQELMLDVGDGHQLYIHDWGSKNAATSIVYLHGGPGSHVKNSNRRNFDPTTQRVIFFDQRGCGKSLPLGSLADNTTDHLVADIELIMTKLSVEKCVLQGGSWGSCLALAFTIAHPERVSGLVLNGVYSASKDEEKWLFGGGWRDIFPDVWLDFVASVPAEHHADPAKYHFSQVQNGDKDAIKKSLYILQNVEGAIIRLNDHFEAEPFEDFDPTTASIEMHYATHGFFMDDGHILKNARKITAPVWLIQGRYDMVCRPKIAYELHQALPNSHLVWTINGHLGEHETSTATKMALTQLCRDNT